MAVHFEAQTKDDVKQIRSRELQLESVEKLNNIVPVVNSLDNVDLEKVEAQTAEIKEIVNQNLEEQPNIEEVIDKIEQFTNGLNDLSDAVNSLKKSNTQVKKTLTEVKNNIKKIDEKLEE